jgi:hypothetical protein
MNLHTARTDEALQATQGPMGNPLAGIRMASLGTYIVNLSMETV